MILRAIVVDDEPLARRGIVARIERAGDVAVVAECAHGGAAIEAIRTRRPDVVYLDVQMPGMSGFDVLDALSAEELPEVIFVTAHDSHALRAFDAEALDYLLKPIDDDRFTRTLARARQRVEDRLGRPATHCQRRLLIKDRGRLMILDDADVDYVRAEGDYVRVYSRGRSYLVRDTLAAMEQRLDATRFARIHRSTIVQLDRIRELRPHANREFIVLLKDGAHLKLSRGYRDALQGLLGKLL